MTAPSDDPVERDPMLLALAFAQLWLEVECGRRPPATIEPLMTPRLAAKDVTRWVRGGPLRRPGPARGSFSAPDVFEAVVMARGPERWGALALRLERRGAGWRVSEACRPEDDASDEAGEPTPVEPGALDVSEWLDQQARDASDLSERALAAVGL